MIRGPPYFGRFLGAYPKENTEPGKRRDLARPGREQDGTTVVACRNHNDGLRRGESYWTLTLDLTGGLTLGFLCR